MDARRPARRGLAIPPARRRSGHLAVRADSPYPALAIQFLRRYSVPGLVVIQDQVLKSQQANSDLYTAMVIAHELAHAWIGGLVTMRRREDLWLDEALTTYISRTALAEILPGTAPWAASTSATLPDYGYAQDAETVRKLEALVGRNAIIDGLGALLRRHAHGTATKDDLVRSWSAAARHDLRDWAAETLIPAGREENEPP